MPTAKVIARIYDFLNNNYKINIVYGGAGSGKSYTVAQFLLFERLLGSGYKNKRCLITRKTNPSLKQTTLRLIKELLIKYEIPFKEYKAEQIIKFPNGSEILFRGLDDPEKIKSAEFNYIWMEEATEFSLEDYYQLRLRLRRMGAGKRNQMYLTFNPVGRSNWVYKEFFEKEQSDVAILHTNYLDNPFLDQEYIKILLGLSEQDEAFYKIYTLGEFAEIEHLIYTNYKIVSQLPDEYDEIIYGLDFGFNNPTAVIKIGIKDGIYWIIDELYERHLTNADLIEKLREFVIPEDAPIYCDSAEPARIEEINREGYYAIPAEKNVKNGIDFVKRQKIMVSESCTNFIKEIQGYKWKEDRNGNVLDEPVKFNDHLMDAARYAIYTHARKNNIGIQSIKI